MMYGNEMLSLALIVISYDDSRSMTFAIVDGSHLRRWLKNSLKVSGACVRASEAAQYSTR